jgi:hypothetical protein
VNTTDPQHVYTVSEISDGTVRRVHGYFADLQGAFGYCETEERKKPLVDSARFELFPAPGGEQWLIHGFYGPEDRSPEVSDLVIGRHPVVPAAPVSVPPAADRAALVETAAQAMREHYLVTDREEADADGNLPCRCGAWREPGPMGSDEDDWDSHLADAVLAALPASVDRTAVLDRIREVVRRLAAHAVGFQDVLDESDRGPWGETVGADIAELRRMIDEDAPLSPFYEHPECGFRWHGRDGMDIPMRDGQPVCPRCELATVRKQLRHSDKRREELRVESRRRGRNVLEGSEKIRQLEKKLDEVRKQLGAEILRAGQAETELRRMADEAEYVAAPCSVAGCEPGGEPCSTHERLMAHAEGDHELCAPGCATSRRMAAETPQPETVRCPLCPDAQPLCTPAEARTHFETVHPEERLLGPGPWPLLANREQPEAEVVHGCPPDGSGLTPCCGRTPFELPLGDRISSEAPVTCPGPAVVAQPAKEA